MSEENPSHFQLFGLTFPIYKKRLINYTIFVYLFLGILLTVSVIFFGYEMTNSDIPGGLIAGFLLAYLITLLVD